MTIFTTKQKYNRDLNEYTVKLYQDGKHIQGADYYTDDEKDAQDTARRMVIDGLINHIIHKFKDSEDYRDMCNDGLAYHFMYWVEHNYPNMPKDDRIMALDKLRGKTNANQS